jgi:hypothetical protein
LKFIGLLPGAAGKTPRATPAENPGVGPGAGPDCDGGRDEGHDGPRWPLGKNHTIHNVMREEETSGKDKINPGAKFRVIARGTTGNA